MPKITPQDLFPGVVNVESTWNPNAVGPAIPGRSERAIGMTQILPSTAKQYGFSADDLKRPDVQWTVYNKHMGYLLNKYKDNPARALAAWNDGEANVDKNSIAPSTLKYVDNALKKTPRIRELLGGAVSPDMSWIDKMVASDDFKRLSPRNQAEALKRATEGSYARPTRPAIRKQD